ncbi:phage tail sheath family protein [Paenibacillus cellulositrophicus]|uniref:phage tail sheath family protein n=1 Tax=Paenibacillus cellulositrophicus TaxID=562959 RepID=UPI003F8161D7
MAGGTWESTNQPVLPGLYMNFKAAATSAIQGGSRGTVIVPVKANWGPVREFVEIGSEQAIAAMFAADSENGATAYPALYLALLGGPKKLLAYRLADDTAQAAAVTLQSGDAAPAAVLKLTAKHPGSRGNGFTVTVQPALGNPAAKELRLYEGAKLLGTFTGADGTAASLAASINGGNDWVTAEAVDGGGVPADVSGLALTGGASGIGGLTNADYVAMQEAAEGQDFDLLALDYAADMALLQSFAAWIKRLRGEGRGVMAVFGGSAADDVSKDAADLAAARSLALNHEGIVNVGTGVRLSGTDYSSAQTAAYVAGLIAGQRLNQSATYAVTPFEDVTRRWTRSEQEQAVKSGVFLLFFDGRQVKALRSINTLATPAEGQSSAWKKIRSIRVMDAINADLQRAAEQTYIGRVNNTEEGRLALIGAVKEYLGQLSLSSVIELDGYDVILDPAYYGDSAVKQPEPDQVFLQWNVKLTDVMEQLFGTFYVQ